MRGRKHGAALWSVSSSPPICHARAGTRARRPPCQLLRNVIGLDAVQEIRVGRRHDRRERQFHLQLMISG